MRYPIKNMALLALLLPLAACGDFLDMRLNEHVLEARKSHEFREGNRVDMVKYNHQVDFAGGASTPSDTQLNKLDTFLTGIQLGYGDDVILQGGTRARRQALDIYLQRKGLPIQIKSEPGATGQPAANNVNVTVERYVVTPPACPNWSNFDGNEQRNAPGSNYGCATDASLGYMVANPRDLVEGQAMGPAMSAHGIEAERRYETDKVDIPKLPRQTNASSDL